MWECCGPWRRGRIVVVKLGMRLLQAWASQGFAAASPGVASCAHAGLKGRRYDGRDDAADAEVIDVFGGQADRMEPVGDGLDRPGSKPRIFGSASRMRRCFYPPVGWRIKRQGEAGPSGSGILYNHWICPRL
jgi:hypothetical protein